MMDKITASYDAVADVLYIALGEPKAAVSEEGEAGVMFRFTDQDHERCGVTVMDYRHGWDDQPAELARIVADFLGRPPDEVATAIHWAVEPP